MNAATRKLYTRFRSSGDQARHAIRSARTLAQWQRLESCTLVRIQVMPDEDSQLSDVIGECDHAGCIYNPAARGHRVTCPRCQSTVDKIERDGIVGIVGDYSLTCDCTSPEDCTCHHWQHGGSIWGCAGYLNPASPFENAYVVDIMAETISALRAALTSRCATCRRPA